VEDQWNQAISVLGGVPTDAAADLTLRYGEPHRAYHNASHVAAVLREAQEIASLPAEDWAVLVLAICAHDVVYDARPGDDERASAAWARDKLTEACVPSRRIAQVSDLVLATLGHESDDPLAHILLDADLSILGAEPDIYDGYAVAVRAEYSAVPDDLWRVGRSKVLRGLLDRADLFHTPQGVARWDAPARVNLRRELSILRDGSPKL
jgi:predicted metal-dependent HD superfamily phosphohydrolase